MNNWQNRISAVRDEADVLRDRERISKVLQSPHKEPLPIDMIKKREEAVEKSLERRKSANLKKKKDKVSKLIK